MWCFVLLISLGSCSNNIFNDFVNKSEDDWILDATRKYVDEEDFDSAIKTITPLLSRRSTDEEVAYIASVAYAGRAGLRVINVLESLVSDITRKGLLFIFADIFKNATASQTADLETAMGILETYGSRAVNRSPATNFYALFVYYARIGMALGPNALDSNGLRANFHGCHKVVNLAAATTGLTNAQVDIVQTSFARIVDTASFVSGLGSIDDLVDTSLVPSGLSFSNFCSVGANETSVTCLALRTLINVGFSDGGIGLGVDAGDSSNYNSGAGGYTCDTLTP